MNESILNKIVTKILLEDIEEKIIFTGGKKTNTMVFNGKTSLNFKVLGNVDDVIEEKDDSQTSL